MIGWGKQGLSWLDDKREQALRALVGDSAYDTINQIAEPLNRAAALPGAGSPIGVPATLLGVTDRMLAANRLSRAFERDPIAMASTIRQVPGGYTARAPVVSKMEDALEVGHARPAGWDLRPFEQSAGGPEGLTLVARSYGAVSPATEFVKSLDELYRALWMRARGVPFTPELLRAEGIGAAGAKAGNLRRAAAGEPLVSFDQRYQGKTEGLSRLMLGEPQWVPDRHGLVLTGQGAEASIRHEIARLGEYMRRHEGRHLTPGEVYMRYEDAMRRGMMEAAGTRFGQQTFPDIWEGIRQVRGEPYQRGVVEIMSDIGSLRPGALVDPAHLERVVRRGLVRSAARVR